jgi:hypothetical protein
LRRFDSRWIGEICLVYGSPIGPRSPLDPTVATLFLWLLSQDQKRFAGHVELQEDVKFALTRPPGVKVTIPRESGPWFQSRTAVSRERDR